MWKDVLVAVEYSMPYIFSSANAGGKGIVQFPNFTTPITATGISSFGTSAGQGTTIGPYAGNLQTWNKDAYTSGLYPVSQQFVVQEAISGVFTWNCTLGTVDGFCADTKGDTFTYAFPTVAVGASVASASTITPTASMFHITGTAAINTMTPPAVMSYSQTGGCLTAYADGAWTTTTNGNFNNAITAVAGNMYQVCYDGTTTKWYIK